MADRPTPDHPDDPTPDGAAPAGLQLLPITGLPEFRPGDDLAGAIAAAAPWLADGDVLIGEVSTVNDDVTDNIFVSKIGRFAEIEEDVAPTHLLVSDYEKWLA